MAPHDTGAGRLRWHGNARCWSRGRGRQFAIGNTEKCLIDLKMPVSHTRSLLPSLLPHSLTPPCAAKLNNDGIVVGEKRHHLHPGWQGQGHRGLNHFFICQYPFPARISPCAGKGRRCRGIGAPAGGSGSLSGCDIPHFSSKRWTTLLSHCRMERATLTYLFYF